MIGAVGAVVVWIATFLTASFILFSGLGLAPDSVWLLLGAFVLPMVASRLWFEWWQARPRKAGAFAAACATVLALLASGGTESR